MAGLSSVAGHVFSHFTCCNRKAPPLPTTPTGRHQPHAPQQLVQPRIEIEPALLGYPLEAVVSLATSASTMRETATALAAHPSARYVTTVAGTSSVIHQGVFRHDDDLATFLTDDLGEHSGITAFEVSVVLHVLTRYWTPHRGGCA